MTSKEIIDLYKDKYGYVSDIDDVIAFLKDNDDISLTERNAILYAILEWNLRQDEVNRKKLMERSKRVKEVIESTPIKEKKKDEDTESSLIDVSSYILSLKKCDDDDFLTELLPSIYDNNYESIIMAILLYFYQEISLASEMIAEESDEESIVYLKELIRSDKKLINVIKKYNQDEEETKIDEDLSNGETKENTLIFLSKGLDSLYIDSDIDDIAIEDDVLPILNDIKTNRIFREKRFHNNVELKGISAIRRRDSRIIFARIDSDVIVILGILVKRCQNPTTYRDMIQARSKRFKAVRDELKELIQSQEFIDKNEEVFQRVTSKLNKRAKVLTRSDNDGTTN